MKYSEIPSSEFKFYTRTWTTPKEPVATVVFHHGFAEHVDRYTHVFEEIAKSGIEVFGYDGRGFGQSATKDTAGVTGGWAQQLRDLDFHVVKQRRPNVPQFVWGHSMGGALVLKYALDGPSRAGVRGFIASAPLIKQHPSQVPNFFVLKAGSLAARFLPDQIIPVSVPVETCTRDPVKIREGQKDDLLRPFGSLRGVAEMLAGGETLLLKEQTDRFNVPLLLIHGTGDIVTSHIASRQFFGQIKSQDKTYNEYEDAYHECHNDIGREKVIEDCKQWILSRSK